VGNEDRKGRSLGRNDRMRSATVLVDQVRVDQEGKLAFEKGGVLGGRKNGFGVVDEKAAAEAMVVGLPDSADAGCVGFGDLDVHLHGVFLKPE